MSREYWQKRIIEEGAKGVSTVGDVVARTIDERSFLITEILKIFSNPVELAIDFGAGWGRLLPVTMRTAKRQILVDFIEDNKKLWEKIWPFNTSCQFKVSSIKDFHGEELADYALTSFSLLHIINNIEYEMSVQNIIHSIKPGGYLFIYESYNEDGEVAAHCSSRSREQFLKPFKDCEIVKEINWKSKYQPQESGCCQPIKLFIFQKVNGAV